MTDEENHGWQLAVEFVDQSPSFAHGFEMGRLYQMMKVEAAPFNALVMSPNREMVVRICGRLGWSARVEDLDEHWVKVWLERAKKPALAVIGAGTSVSES